MYIIFILLDIPSIETIKGWYEALFHYTPSTLCLVMIALAIITIPFALGGLWKWIKHFFNISRWRNNYKSAVLSEFRKYTDIKEQRLFIQTRIQEIPPYKYEDISKPRFRATTEPLIPFYIENVLRSDNDNPCIYLVLAGSGMGKTTFAVHLVEAYIDSYTKETIPIPNIALLPCGNKNVLDRIDKIDKKNETILILDALDENPEALKDVDSFLEKLEDAVEPFRIVIITSRTHFFLEEDFIPKTSHILLQSRDKGRVEYQKHFISPFSSTEVDTYLKKLFHCNKIWKTSKYKKAKKIVEKCNKLIIRPLLLSYVDQLVEADREYQTAADIYEELIHRWLKREVDSFPSPPQDLEKCLYDSSIALAVNIYEHHEEYGGWFIPKDKFDDFVKDHLNLPADYKFSVKSLIEWDAKSNQRFAHRSFLEFLLAKEMVRNLSFKKSLYDVDVADLFYKEMCDKLFNEECKKGNIEQIPYSSLTLHIKHTPECRYDNILVTPTFLFISADLLSQDFFDWVNANMVKNLIIYNYDGRSSINGVKNLANLEYLKIQGQAVSKTLAKTLVQAKVFYSYSSDTSISMSTQDCKDVITSIWGEKRRFKFSSPFNR